MKQSERAAMMRIISDLLKADGIIDSRELNYLDDVRSAYGITRADEAAADLLTFAEAVNILKHTDDAFHQAFLSRCLQMAMSDNFCARPEALLLLALRLCLDNRDDAMPATIFSVATAELEFDDTQVLYIESGHDASANSEIATAYQAICNEVRLAGFDFVYLPHIAAHYSSIPVEQLQRIVEYLYPRISPQRAMIICRQICNLTTARFCADQLVAKLGMSQLADVPPSLMVRIGESVSEGRTVANFLLVELDVTRVATSISHILSLFTRIYRNSTLNYLTEEAGRFVYKGFHRQLFDILVLRRGIRSRAVADFCREEILLPEADTRIEGIHRREKALFALFLLESPKGGIPFGQPADARQRENHLRSMEAIQKRYNRIYALFGGDPQKAPDLTKTATRAPMLALLKKQTLKLSDVLHHVDDYIIRRNNYGCYQLTLHPNLCCLCIDSPTNIQPFQGSETERILVAL